VSGLTLPDYLKVKRFTSYSTNLYLIIDGGEALLIDAHVGAEADQAVKYVEENLGENKLKQVVLTHWHYDHVGSCPMLEERYKPTFSAHPADAWLIENPRSGIVQAHTFGELTEEAYRTWLRDAGGRGVRVGKLLRDGDVVQVGSVELQVLHTPGHQYGGVSLYDPVEKALFSGDAFTPTVNFDTWLGFVVDSRSYLETLMRLSNLDVNTLFPAHEAIRSGGEVAVEARRQLERFNRIESEILSVLARSEWNMLNEVADEVVRRVLVGRSDAASFTEVATVHSCLGKLIYEGKVKLVKGGFHLSR
jgi:hydroxyacylglutathione hydrolase